ncbi:hypothetical protein Mpsy_3132 [Methanolobus psychrophilus R15]|nr:hypothetical protein Mpsy_3132 [Methanolobus psychrophilus R15]
MGFNPLTSCAMSARSSARLCVGFGGGGGLHVFEGHIARAYLFNFEIIFLHPILVI